MDRLNTNDHRAPSPGRRSELPPPPYFNRGTRQLTIKVRFDREAAREIVPRELEIAEQPTGGFNALVVTDGWGLAPYTKAASWVDVAGFDTPDGSPGRYYWQGFLSGKAFEYYNSVFSQYYMRGGVVFARSNGVIEASCGDGVHEYLRLSAIELHDESAQRQSGVMSCLGSPVVGGMVYAPVPFTHTIRPAEPLDVAVTTSKGSRLARMRPSSLIEAYCTDEFSYTAGHARKLVDDGEQASESLFELLSHEGRGALLVDEKSRIVFGNDLAFSLLGDGLEIRSNSLVASVPEVQDKLQRLISASCSIGGGGAWETMSVRRLEHTSPLLVTALPTALSHTSDLTGRPIGTVVVLITDPALRASRPPSAALLLLLGLTPAEARVAAAVSTEKGRKQAAESLGLTDATVRVTLSTIYAKLGLSGAKELGRLASLLGPL